jgi:glutamyl-tRNA reductase
VIDLAVPRNVEAPPPGTAGICVLDLDALCENEAAPGFEASAQRALEVVTAEAAAFAAWRRQSGAGLLIEQVLRHGEAIRRAELARAARLAPAIDPRVLDELTARVVQKVLHAPIAAIRQHAGAGDDDLAALIARTLAGGAADGPAQGSVQV